MFVHRLSYCWLCSLVARYCRRLASKMSARTDSDVMLGKNSNSDGVPTTFVKCCLTALGCSGNGIDVGYTYQNEKLNIYPSSQGVRLSHSPGCPCRFLTATDIANVPDSTKCIGVKVAVAGLLQSSDGHVLLTRRPEHMRTYPCVWVAPGGHVEANETLNQALIRELSEETGLAFSEENLKISTLGLWESVFPAILSLGLPARHHIVVYFRVQTEEDHTTLQGRLKLSQQEVDAAAWLDEPTANDVAASDDYGQSRPVPQRYFRASVVENSQMVEKSLPLSILMSSVPREDGQNKERLSMGTKFALKQSIKLLHCPPLGGVQQGFDPVFQAITKAGHQPLKSSFWGQ